MRESRWGMRRKANLRNNWFGSLSLEGREPNQARREVSLISESTLIFMM
jgi:uncharacterized FlgJ-related protein